MQDNSSSSKRQPELACMPTSLQPDVAPVVAAASMLLHAVAAAAGRHVLLPWLIAPAGAPLGVIHAMCKMRRR